jgi:hypothetical protein
MSKTTVKNPVTRKDQGQPRPSASAVNVPPGDYPSFSDWGAASVAALREHTAQVWLMTRAERVAAYMRGELTHDQIQEWIGRTPREVPKINGEFAHIAASTPEACFRCPVCGDEEVSLAAGRVLSEHADFRHPNWGKRGAYAAGQVPRCPGSGNRPDVNGAVVL